MTSATRVRAFVEYWSNAAKGHQPFLDRVTVRVSHTDDTTKFPGNGNNIKTLLPNRQCTLYCMFIHSLVFSLRGRAGRNQSPVM